MPRPVSRRTSRDRRVLTAEHRTEAAGQPGGIRHALVARIRRQIAEGTYETPDKWEVALARLAHELDIAG